MAGRWIAAAIVTGIALRLLFGLVYWREKPLTQDESEYLAFAANLAAGRGFTRELPGLPAGPSVETFSRAPLYPVLLAGLFRLTGISTDRLPPNVPRVVQVTQALAGGLTIWLVGRLARRACGPGAAAIAAWLAALYPPLVWTSAYALSEAVYSPMVLAAADLAGVVLDRRAPETTTGDVRMMAAAGALAGAAALARSAAVIFIALLAGWSMWRHRRAAAAALLAGAALVILPWSMRNVAVHGRFILVAADGGITFWTGNHPLAIGEGDMAANPAIKESHVEFRRRIEHLTPEQREPYYYRAAFEYIRQHPLRIVWLEVKKVFYTWVPIGPSYTLHSGLYYWTTVLTYIPMLFMAILAWPVLSRSAHPPIALALLVSSAVLVCVIFFPQERFRIPVVDPALCVAAGCRIARRGT